MEERKRKSRSLLKRLLPWSREEKHNSSPPASPARSPLSRRGQVSVTLAAGEVGELYRLGPRSMFGYETFFFGEDEGGVPGIEMNAVSPVCEMLSLGKQEIGDIADHHPAFSEHLYAAMTVSIVDQLTDSTGEGEYWARQRAEKKEREAQRKSS